MITLPKMKYAESASQKQVVKFAGLNFSDAAADGEFSACKNISCRRYPYMSPRLPRLSDTTYKSATSIFAWGHFIVVNGNSLICDGTSVGNVMAGAKQFAVVNTKLCIWPDKKYLDLTTMEFGALEASYTLLSGLTATFTANSLAFPTIGIYAMPINTFARLIRIDDERPIETEYIYFHTATAAAWDSANGWTLTNETEKQPGSIEVGDIVMLEANDVSGVYNLNYKKTYATDKEGTVAISHDYVDNNAKGYYAVITAISQNMQALIPGVSEEQDFTFTFNVLNATTTISNLSDYISVGDRVQISGSNTPGNNTAADVYLKVSSISGNTLKFSTSTLTAGTDTGPVTITRPLPSLDYICESDNRLWGVSNGKQTIYASALGDPRNFFVYESGNDSSAYAVAVASDSNFTAICKYENSVLCWKEKRLHKILGDYPSNYQLATYNFDGVQSGSYKSTVNINEVLYYKGVKGVYAYTGGSPRLISSEFGNREYDDAVAGSDGTRYYISMHDTANVYHLFVYDTLHGLWTQEDDLKVLDFCFYAGKLKMLSAASTVYTVDGNGAKENIDWSAEFAPMYESVQNKKTYSHMYLRVEMEVGAFIMAEISCDDRPFELAFRSSDSSDTTITIPIRPRRCDKFRIRLSGKGNCAVLSMLRELRYGSEV